MQRYSNLYLRRLILAYKSVTGSAASHEFTKLPCWRAKVALGQDKQKAYPLPPSSYSIHLLAEVIVFCRG